MKAIVGEMIPLGNMELAYTEQATDTVLVQYKTDKELLNFNYEQNLAVEISLLSGLLTDLTDDVI